MKIRKETRDKMKRDISIIFPHVKKEGVEKIDISGLHLLWYHVHANRTSNDSDYIIKVNGKRLLSLDKSHALYPDESDDLTLTTALKKIGKELNIFKE